MQIFIEYLNKDKDYQKDIVYFKDYEQAKNWAVKNLENFNPDMIKTKFN